MRMHWTCFCADSALGFRSVRAAMAEIGDALLNAHCDWPNLAAFTASSQRRFVATLA